jgi:hypothetical protein
MAKPLANVTLRAPGFFGMNTETNSSELPPEFAKVADNCVVDDRGRCASREGCQYITTTGGTGSSISQIYEFTDNTGAKTVFSVGNNKVYTGTTTLTDITSGLTITADNWKIVQLNEEVHFFQRGHEPLVWDSTAGLQLHSAHIGASGTPPEANAVAAGYGRLFAGGTATDPHTVYWSDLLVGSRWSGGSSGSIDLQEHWPTGYDEITGLIVHNSFLVVLGKQSILIFTGVENPATMSLQDSIAGIGTIARDSVITTGDDVLFLDRHGFRSLGRTIQEKSSPIGIISKNVTTDLKQTLGAPETIRAVFDRANANVLLMCPLYSFTWCFDTLMPLEDGSFRTTTWSSIELKCGHYTEDGTLYFGSTDGIMQYNDNYIDYTSSAYEMRYYSWYQDFGDAVRIKIPKGADITTEGGSGLQISFVYSYNYTDAYKTSYISLPEYTEAEYGEGEFGEAEFGGSILSVSRNHINLRGSGRNISIGLEATINGDGLAIQEMNVHSVLGRMV